MTTLQERIGNERKRLRAVRQKMMAAVEQKSNGDEAFAPLYIAAADYIEATMARLQGQDVRMGDMIREKVETVDDGVKQALEELGDRLSGAREHLKPFLAARDALREQGAAALEKFEKEGKAYSDFVVANMGHHGLTTDLSAKLFSIEDWEYMAAISDEEIERETELFDRVVASTPANLKEADA
jgi:outer membrane translocation and assembly module TamA